ncbi:hypothetical protein PENTCL1PPCAC_2531, partial [Pristionchus entomophagus]
RRDDETDPLPPPSHNPSPLFHCFSIPQERTPEGTAPTVLRCPIPDQICASSRYSRQNSLQQNEPTNGRVVPQVPKIGVRIHELLLSYWMLNGSFH